MRACACKHAVQLSHTHDVDPISKQKGPMTATKSSGITSKSLISGDAGNSSNGRGVDRNAARKSVKWERERGRANERTNERTLIDLEHARELRRGIYFVT